jgi:hypothetical protein
MSLISCKKNIIQQEMCLFVHLVTLSDIKTNQLQENEVYQKWLWLIIDPYDERTYSNDSYYIIRRNGTIFNSYIYNVPNIRSKEDNQWKLRINLNRENKVNQTIEVGRI